VNCQDDGGPEVETVIAILRSDQPKLQITPHSGVESITDAEIEPFGRNAQANQINRKGLRSLQDRTTKQSKEIRV
jgi:hypothetical protein